MSWCVRHCDGMSDTDGVIGSNIGSYVLVTMWCVDNFDVQLN